MIPVPITWLLDKVSPLYGWVAVKAAANHLPIHGRVARPRMSRNTFTLFVAVAPSDSPKHIPSGLFVETACGFVDGLFADIFPGEPDYSGPDRVRFLSPSPEAPKVMNSLELHPSGLIELQWVLADPRHKTELPLDEIQQIVARLHHGASSGAARTIYAKRWGQSRRRVDWMIGVNGSAHTDEGEWYHWTGVTGSTVVPQRRSVRPNPHCQGMGFAADALHGVSPRKSIDGILRPALEEMLLLGNYTDRKEIEACVSSMLLDAPVLEATSRTGYEAQASAAVNPVSPSAPATSDSQAEGV
jgi:hypothetical protein